MHGTLDLIDRFFAQSANPEFGANTQAFVRSYIADFKNLPTTPAETLPRDVLMFGGKGAGKSTFAQNFMGEPMLFPAAGELSMGHIRVKLREKFGVRAQWITHDDAEYRALHEFLYWSRTPVVLGISGGDMGGGNRGYGRELTWEDRVAMGKTRLATRLSTGHLFFCDPKTALGRVRKRSIEHGDSPEMDALTKTKLTMGQAQTFYAWPHVAKDAEHTFLWDSRGPKLTLMAVIENKPSQNVIFYRANEKSLNDFGFDRQTCAAIWNFSTEFRREYDQLWLEAMHELQVPVQEYDPRSAQLLREPSLTHAFEAIRRQIRDYTEDRDVKRRILDSSNGATIAFNSFAVSSVLPAKFQPYRSINARAPWQPRLAAIAA